LISCHHMSETETTSGHAPVFLRLVKINCGVVLHNNALQYTIQQYKQKAEQMNKCVRFSAELIGKIIEFQRSDGRPTFTSAVHRLIELGIASLEKKG